MCNAVPTTTVPLCSAALITITTVVIPTGTKLSSHNVQQLIHIAGFALHPTILWHVGFPKRQGVYMETYVGRDATGCSSTAGCGNS